MLHISKKFRPVGITPIEFAKIAYIDNFSDFMNLANSLSKTRRLCDLSREERCYLDSLGYHQIISITYDSKTPGKESEYAVVRLSTKDGVEVLSDDEEVASEVVSKLELLTKQKLEEVGEKENDTSS